MTIKYERADSTMGRPRKNSEITNTEAEVMEQEAAMETTAKKTKKATPKKGASGTPFVEKFNVRMFFVQPFLGSAPNSSDIYKRFIASKAPDAPTREEELLNTTVENVAAKGVNVFLRRSKTGAPCVGQHTVKGFYKESMTAVRRQGGTVCDNISGHKTKIAGNIVISPTYIDLKLPTSEIVEKTEEEFKETGFGKAGVVVFPKEGRYQEVKLRTYDRPLRANTPQGEIVSIASSEMAPAGTEIEYDLKVEMDGLSEGIINMILRGNEHGTGQFRTSGEYGEFVAEIRNEAGEIVANNTKSTIGCTSDDPEFYDKLWEYIDEISL